MSTAAAEGVAPIAELMDEHTALVAHLDRHVRVHVEREDLGIFPVSVTTLGASGWAMVDEAHTESPSFLLDAPEPQPPHEEESTCRRSH